MLERDVSCTRIRGLLGALVCGDCKNCKAEGGRLICTGESGDDHSISQFDEKCEDFDCYIDLTNFK